MSPRQRKARARRRRRGIVDAVVWTASVLFLVAGWPQALGGQFGIVVVRGTSMLPTFHSADLLIVQRISEPEVGDVIAYSIPGGAHVVHRIIGGDAVGGYRTRGDNRTTTDPWFPRREDISGSVLLHIPYLGRFFSVWVGLVGAAAASVLLSCALWPGRDDRRRSGEAGEGESGGPTIVLAERRAVDRHDQGQESGQGSEGRDDTAGVAEPVG